MNRHVHGPPMQVKARQLKSTKREIVRSAFAKNTTIGVGAAYPQHR